MGNYGKKYLQSDPICLLWDRKMLGRNIACVYSALTLFSHHHHCWVGQMDHWLDSTLQCVCDAVMIAGFLGSINIFRFYIHILFLFMIIPMGVLHTFLVILLIYCILPYFRYSASASKEGLQQLILSPLRQHIKSFTSEELFSR